MFEQPSFFQKTEKKREIKKKKNPPHFHKYNEKSHHLVSLEPLSLSFSRRVLRKPRRAQGSGRRGRGRGGGDNMQELSLKSRNGEEWGKEKTHTKKDGHQVGRLVLPTPTLYISLLLPATSSVFQFERHTACTIQREEESSSVSRHWGSLWRYVLLKRKRTGAQDARPCAHLFLQPGTCPHNNASTDTRRATRILSAIPLPLDTCSFFCFFSFDYPISELWEVEVSSVGLALPLLFLNFFFFLWACFSLFFFFLTVSEFAE